MTRVIWSPRWRVKHIRNGKIIWQEEIEENVLHDEGEQFMLQVVFDEVQSVPASYFIGLDNRAAPAEGDALTDLTGEPSGSGYARQEVPSDNVGWTVSQSAGDYQAASTTETFAASGGDWTSVQQMFLCTTVTGTDWKLVATAALSTPRLLKDGDSLDTDITIKLSE